ncbi:hypothetical protein H4R21_001932 [Coemansia helicoidea]|uniref:Uncharacterized protein n=1 Tax=Coemansia helicoidea TaxID=1286919 RepID=A0ACC1L9R6_9FUNG|nr:hypothetical protein H4R21_001932 [Coemansia helicoidea]
MADDELQSLESIMELLDSADQKKPAGRTDPAPLRLNRHRDEGSADDDPTSLGDLLSAIEQNSDLGHRRQNGTRRPAGGAERSARNASPSSGDDASDPMLEFERILADLASSDTQAYRSDKPAPLFWDEDAINKEYGESGRFAKNLGPKLLFEEGPRASAHSAGRLTGDQDKVSAIAARIQRISRDSKQKGGQGAAGPAHARRQQKLDQELEHNLLSRLASCRSVPVLSNFVYTDLLSRKITVAKGMASARPSATVFAEVMRKARELQAPSVAYYVYKHCCTRLGLVDRLRVLNHEVYAEILATAWQGPRDISMVFLIMQNIVAAGTLGGRSLERQIDQIASDLRATYNMPAAAENILALKAKITPDAGASDSRLHQIGSPSRSEQRPFSTSF